jgi:hypothetical protein
MDVMIVLYKDLLILQMMVLMPMEMVNATMHLMMMTTTDLPMQKKQRVEVIPLMLEVSQLTQHLIKMVMVYV